MSASTTLRPAIIRPAVRLRRVDDADRAVDASTVELAVAVADEYDGQGIGRRLFEVALAWAGEHQIETVVATADRNAA